MKILLAPDSFKGSLSSIEIIEIMEREAKKVFQNCETVPFPIADGGEGTLAAILTAVDGIYETVTVKDPLFQEVEAQYGIIDNSTAVIEMAQASGLPLVPAKSRNPMNTTTFGTGQLISDALDKGCKKIVIGLGGSATNDGGMGMLTALGIKFLDADGTELLPVGQNLIKVRQINVEKLDSRLANTEIVVMCDITNPLLGTKGATYVFGPQKGAGTAELSVLEAGMENLSKVASKLLNKDCSNAPGAGAAGGMGWALKMFLNATLQSGISTILDICHFEEKLESVDLVVSGEGHADGQSVDGKVLSGIGSLCKAHNVPVLAIVGGMSMEAESLYDLGVTSIVTTINDIMTIENAMLNAEKYMSSATKRAFVLIKVGTQVKKE